MQFHAARRLFLRERASKLCVEFYVLQLCFAGGKDIHDFIAHACAFFNRYSPAAYFTSKLTIDVVLLRVIPACFYAGMVHLLVQVGPVRHWLVVALDRTRCLL